MLHPAGFLPILLHMVVGIWVTPLLLANPVEYVIIWMASSAFALSAASCGERSWLRCFVHGDWCDSCRLALACRALLSIWSVELQGITLIYHAGLHLHSLPATDHSRLQGAKVRLELGHHTGRCCWCARKVGSAVRIAEHA